MGALTLKSFPFELRGWDIEKLESIDPTDSFGSNTQVYVSKNQIIQVEPDFNINSSGNWLTDKGRQFFDGIFGTWNPTNEKDLNKLELTSNNWLEIIKKVSQTLYMFEHCKTQQNNINFITIVFENLSIEMLSLLTIISQNQTFIKLRRMENLDINNDLEANFQLNLVSNKVKLSSSTLCLLVSTNPRYEGYHLNLHLRQRFLKGDFKCLTIGSLTNLTFPVSFLGSNSNVLKTIAEGNNLICQEFKYAKNPMLVMSNELIGKGNKGKSLELLKILKYSNLLNNSWNGINLLNSSLAETGIQTLRKFKPLNKNDLTTFSMLYFLNVTSNNLSNLKKITQLKLLNQSNNINPVFLDQNSKLNNNIEIVNSLNNITNTRLKEYYALPSSMFYENNETFVNTEGFVKRTNKIILKKKTKNNWQILRRLHKHVQTTLTFLSPKSNNLIIFNSKNLDAFKKYIHFHYQATQTLTSMNFHLNIKNESFMLFNDTSNFKQRRIKLKSTKLKYWLDDFFNGGKDEYSQHSLVLSNCSKILRTKSTNFF